MKNIVLISLIALMTIPKAFSWGGRGHTIICEASIYLVQDQALRTFLKERSHMLNHLCLVPDVYWRGLYPESKIGNTTHYINHEKFNPQISSISLKYPKGKVALEKKAKELGSNWWRGEQFYRLAISDGKVKNLEGFLINIGLMGHFIGDNGVAFHVVEDFDGRNSGHSGLHDFYESHIPSLLDSDLLSQVIDSGKAEEIEYAGFLESMRSLSSETFKDLPFILETDPVTKKSFTDKPAIRKSPEAVLSIWKPIIIKAMGRSAALMAKAIDEAYRLSGKPNLEEAKIKFPLRPAYVKPDYLEH